MLLVLVLVVPTGLLAWLAVRGVRDERRRVAGQLGAAAASRLADLDARVGRLLDDRARRLTELTDGIAPDDAAAWRRLVRTAPEIAQLAVQAADGRLLHPPLAAGVSDAEADYLRRIRGLLEDGALVAAAAPSPEASSQKLAGPAADHGFLAWYWDTGLHLLWWRRTPSGAVVAAELDRARLLADLAVALPSGAGDGGPWRRITLLDSRGDVLVQSGAPAAEGEAAAAVERRLAPPLAAWTLRAELVGAGGPGALGGFLRAAALVVVAAVLVGLAVVFYRESSRELREAAQRVRFVNQVSHELRTPLTNIRLYAELAERRLADDDEARSHLAVIVAESARLGRLIGNVLSFARSRRGELAVHPVPGVVDDTLRAVAAQFAPSLESRGVELALDLDAPRPIPFDADAVEQVLGNLLANVEKYAAAGGRAEIVSRQGGGATRVRVADRGPGIPAAAAERIFEPFVRLSDRLSEGVSGTGIGLAIARDLARAHGGELRLVPSERGACFALELPGPTAGGER